MPAGSRIIPILLLAGFLWETFGTSIYKVGRPVKYKTNKDEMKEPVPLSIDSLLIERKNLADSD